MKKSELLKMIRNNDYVKFSEFLIDKGDPDQRIKGKSLLENALRAGNHDCIVQLFLHGADIVDVMESEELSKIAMKEPLYVDFLRELTVRFDNTKTIQTIMQELCRNIVGPYPQSYRNVLSYGVRKQGYYSMLACGIHWFEWMDWDYLTTHVKKAFQLEDPMASGKETSLAMLVTVRDSEQMGEEIPGQSLRITGYLFFQESPLYELEKYLKKAKDNEELILGVRFRNDPALEMRPDGEVDISGSFFDSMKEAIGEYLNPPFFSSGHAFSDLANWDHELNRQVEAFKVRNGVYPNILLASSQTYARIEMVANTNGQERIRNPEGEKAQDFAQLGGFQGKGYCLEFCLDEELPLNHFKLIHDHGGGGGGEREDEWMDAIAG